VEAGAEESASSTTARAATRPKRLAKARSELNRRAGGVPDARDGVGVAAALAPVVIPTRPAPPLATAERTPASIKEIALRLRMTSRLGRNGVAPAPSDALLNEVARG